MLDTPIHIISLGAGWQSSCMALMTDTGKLSPRPVCAIFADTQREPESVYSYLSYLCGVIVNHHPDGRPYVTPGRYSGGVLGYPVHIVTAGDLGADTLRVRERKDKLGSWCPSGIPHYSTNADGSAGHGQRQCTHDFKLIPLAREQRKVMREHGVKKCIIWIGISVDEISRCKPSRVNYAEHRWPLLELEMNRQACKTWINANGFKPPGRSACEFCPYKSDSEWRKLKAEEPAAFLRAVKFEQDYQAAKAQTLLWKRFVPWLHPKRIPLDQIDFSTEEQRGQLNMFNNECEGMCGV